MTRLLAIGLLLLALSPTGPLVAQSTEVWLIQNEPLQENVGVRVRSQPEQVQLYVDRAAPFDGTALPEVAIQAWLLRSDGTALLRSGPAQKTMTWGRRSPGGGTTWSTTCSFAPTNPQDLAAVVVSLDGMLFVRTIPQKTAN